MKMTIKKAKEILRPLNITFNSVVETGEYRVNFVGGKEESAYYDTDIEDALATGIQMAKWKEEKKV
jgi:hypothetical protein